MTMQLNQRLNECARNLNDGKLLALLSGGDVVALELKYHSSCLAALYNRERGHTLRQRTKKNFASRLKKSSNLDGMPDGQKVKCLKLWNVFGYHGITGRGRLQLLFRICLTEPTLPPVSFSSSTKLNGLLADILCYIVKGRGLAF